MKKTLFLAVAALGFFSVDADAGVIFKKKSKSCTSCNSSKAAAVVAAPARVQVVPQKKVQAPSPVKSQAPVAPQKKVQAPSPVKSQAPVAPQKKVEAPSPVKAQNAAPAKTVTEKKKVFAPQQ
jgi:hypothetical protein